MSIILIDKNRINLSDMNPAVKDKARELGLLDPISDAPKFTTKDYKPEPIDLASKENREELVDVADYGIASVPYYREQARNNPTYNTNIATAPEVNYLREGVCKKLQQVNEILDPLGLEVVVCDGHREISTQRSLYNSFLKKAEEKGLSGQDAHKDAQTYCSCPDGFDAKNPQTWPLHSTGGAVDIYLMAKETKRVIDFGEGYFDNPDDVTHTDYYENPERTARPEQTGFRDARRVLYNAMRQAGFTNYGSECFHYGFGDQYSALVARKNGKGTEPAKYGYKTNPRDRLIALTLQAAMAKKSR